MSPIYMFADSNKIRLARKRSSFAMNNAGLRTCVCLYAHMNTNLAVELSENINAQWASPLLWPRKLFKIIQFSVGWDTVKVSCLGCHPSVRCSIRALLKLSNDIPYWCWTMQGAWRGVLIEFPTGPKGKQNHLELIAGRDRNGYS